MVWIGKVAGALLGYALARLPGALIGLILGHQFDRGMSPRGRRRSRGGGSGGARAGSSERQRVFFETTFTVMGHLAKVDGRVSEADIAAARQVMRRMQLGEREMRLAMDLFNSGKRPDHPVDEDIERLRRHCVGQRQLLITFLEIQVDLALNKGSITSPEHALLGRIAEGLGLSLLELVRIETLLRARRRFTGGSPSPPPRESALEKAYGVLGVPATASDREVKTAYRRLMNQHHPDKQVARGLPEAMLEMAKERTGEIRAAYETVRDSRGFR